LPAVWREAAEESGAFDVSDKSYSHGFAAASRQTAGKPDCYGGINCVANSAPEKLW